MTEKANWADIPSLDGVGIDWDYTPKNPLGKRQWARILKDELHSLLDRENITVKIASKTWNQTGVLLDISHKGLAVLIKNEMTLGAPVKVGLFLARHKVITKAIVRNCISKEQGYRVGIEFSDLNKDSEEYIIGINSANTYKRAS